MGQTLNAIIPWREKIYFIPLFAYANRGLSALKIVGIKNHTLIEKKILYYLKISGQKIPPRVVTIGVDQQIEDGSWLEWPIYLLYWIVVFVIPFHNLEKCLTWGRLHLQRGLEQDALILNAQMQKNPLFATRFNSYTLIVTKNIFPQQQVIRVEDLSEDFGIKLKGIL